MATNKWVPLPKIAHGTAITSFTPTHMHLNATTPSPQSRPTTIHSSTYFSSSTDSSLVNDNRPHTASSDVSNSASNDYAYLLPLEVGDDLYIFEQNGAWYRGYVLESLEEGKKPNTAPNGIFPKSHVQIKEYVDLDWSVNDRFLKHSSAETPSSTRSATNATVNSHYSDSMTRPSSFGGNEYDDPPPLLAPTSIPFATSSPSVSSTSRPARDIDFDNNFPSIPGDLQPQHQRQTQNRLTTMDAEQESQQMKRPSPPPLPMIRFDQSTLTGVDEPLVDEIAACASEWNSLLYTYLQEKQYSAFNAVRDHINYLFQARRQLLDQALSSEELCRLRKEIIQRMVTMNISQHREMIIRHPEHGFILDINNTSASTLYYMHWKYTISDQIPVTTLFPQPCSPGSDSSTNPSTSPHAPNTQETPTSTTLKNLAHGQRAGRRKPFYHYKGGEFHHLFLELKACVARICQPGEWTELRFSLYSDSQGKFVTEPFVAHLNYNGMPKDESQIKNIQTLFTDLAYQDLNEHLYLVCHIFRLGGMKFVDKEKDHMKILGQHASTLFGGGNHHHKNQSRRGPKGNGFGYFEYSNKHDQSQQPSAYPNESTSLPSSAHTNLFRRPFGCAVLDIGRLLHQVNPANTTVNSNFSKSGVPSSRQQRPYMNTEMIRTPTLSNAAHYSSSGIEMSSPTRGSTNAAPFIPMSAGSSSSGSSTTSTGKSYTGQYYLLSSDHNMRIYLPSSESEFAHLHQDIIRDNTKEFTQNNCADKVSVYLRMFYGQQDEVLMKNAALLHGLPLTARIGFPDVVFPDNDRNELYITLKSGDFAHFGRTRNIQVIICARDNYTGDVVEMAVAVGSGTPRTSTWESAIYYHDMKPTWNEMVKVKISDVKIWQRSHVFLVVKHRSRHGGGASSLRNGSGNSNASGGSRGFKPATSAPALTRLTAEGNTSSSDKILAVGYIPLFIPPQSHDFVADGTHTLCLYKYDRQLLHPSSYFGVVPWCSQTTAPINMEGQENMLAAVRQVYRQNSANRQHSNSSHANAKLGDSESIAKSHPGSHHHFASVIGLQHQYRLHSAESSLGNESTSGNNVYPNGGANTRLHAVRDSLVLSTFLCSTQFTQNTALVKLINWRSIVRHDDDSSMTADDESADELLAILDKFTFVGEREVVKFLADVFDALLDILVFRVPGFPEKQDALHDQVIVAITWILSIVQDRRFSNFRPVLNVYINQRFYCSDEGDDDNSIDDDDGLYSSSAHHTDEMINNMNLYGVPVRRLQDGNTTLMDNTNPIFKRDADTTGTYQLYTSYRYRLKHNKKLRQKMTLSETTYNQLLQGLIRLSTNPSDTTKAKRLRSSVKGWEYLFLFIKRSRDMHRANEDRDQHELREQMYKRDLQRFFELTVDMMRPHQPSSMIGTQTLILQHFCEAITEVKNAYSPKEIVDIISTLVDACSHVTGKLVGFKLNMILSVIKAPIFSDKAFCFELGKLVIGWIKVWLNSYMVAAKDVIFARTMDSNGLGQDNTQQQTRLPRAQWLENLRISLTIVHEVLEKIRKVRGMSLSGLSLATINSPPTSSATTPASTTTTPRTRPTSMSTLGDDDFESIISDVYDEYVTTGNPLDTLTTMLIYLVPQLLQAYKDLQRLTTQAIQATASSDNTIKSVPTPMNVPMTNRNTVNSVPLSLNSGGASATGPNTRHSLATLRERAGSIRDLPQVPESSADINLAAVDQSKTATTGFPVVLQALAASPTTPFPSVFPFQANATNDAAVMAGSDLATMVTCGLLDLTVVLLDLFHLTPRNQWLYVLQSMAANKDGAPENGGGGSSITADYICTLCYVCMAILFGDDVYKLAETHGTVEGYDAFMEDPTRDRRRWPSTWLNLDVVAYKIILENILSPVAELLKMDAFMPKQQQQSLDSVGRKVSTSTSIGGHDDEGDTMVRLWRVVFMTVVRVLASPSLEVETLLPQAQRAVWKLAGNIRGDEGIGVLKRLWDLTGPQRRPPHLSQQGFRQRQKSKDLKMKPQLLDYFDHHREPMHQADAYGEDDTDDDISGDTDVESMPCLSDNGESGENGDITTLNKEPILPSDGDDIRIHLESMPVLLRPLCAASLTLHNELRSTTVGFIADMIAIHMRKANNSITGQNLMIGTIDKLVMTNGKGSDEIRVKWVAELQQAFQQRLTTDSERAWGLTVVDSLANLMELLLQIRSLPLDSAEFMDERINATLKLMKFIQVCERQEIYIKYVHQLVDLHLHNRNFVEAALTLRFHSDLLQWDPYGEVEAIPELGYTAESSFARKKGLYDTMIAYLDKGAAWELCIDLCQEIGDQYASTVVNYPLCGAVLRQRADFMDKIVTKERYYSEYFRVGFYGRGFPASIRNQHFIYRGMAWEKMSSFVERMQNRHPNAQLVSGKLPTGSLLRDDQIKALETELDGQYMQITAVTPVTNPLANPVLMNSFASDKIKKYYQFNNVSQFTYSKPVTREDGNDNTGTNDGSNGCSNWVDTAGGDNSNDDKRNNSVGMLPKDKSPILSKQELDFLHLWTERTTFTSEDVFPTITLRSKIVSIEVNEISPIQNAVEAMNNKTYELVILEKNYSAYLTNPQISFNLNPFSMALNGAVDAPVNGGVSLYKKAFLSPYFAKRHPEMSSWVDQLKAAIDEQVIVIDRCLDTHGQLVSSQMRPFHDNMIELYRKNFTDDIAQLHRRGTTLKAVSTRSMEKGKRVHKVSNSNKNVSRKCSVPQSGLRNLNASISHPNLSTGHQYNNRPGSAFFRDVDKPLMVKSRTNSASSQQQSLISPGGTGHLSPIVTPKSTSYFSIQNLREQQPTKCYSDDRLQKMTSTTSATSDEMANSPTFDYNQQHRHHGNSNASALSAPSSLIHPNDQFYFEKNDDKDKVRGLSKSLKKSIQRVRNRRTSFGESQM